MRNLNICRTIPRLLLFGLFLLAICQWQDVGAPVGAQSPQIEINIDPAVDRFDAQLVEQGVWFAEEFFTESLGFELYFPVTVTVSPEADSSNSMISAYTQGDAITVLTGSEAWRLSSPIERLETVVHEYAHVYQYGMTGYYSDYSAWFEEGTADYLAATALDQAGILNRGDFDAYYSLVLDEFPITVSLQQLEPVDAFQEQDAEVYSLAYFAIEEAVSDSGLSSIGDYYLQISNGASFESAFQSAFGIDLGTFYSKMDSINPPHLDNIPLAFWEIEPAELNADLVWLDRPTLISTGLSEVFEARTIPSAVCSLTADGGSADGVTSWPAFADANGTVFWMVRFTEFASPGITLQAECGDDPVSLSIPVG